MNNQQSKWFDLGYACAVATLINQHGISTEARNVYEENFISLKRLRELGAEETDINFLIPLIEEIQEKNGRLI